MNNVTMTECSRPLTPKKHQLTKKPIRFFTLENTSPVGEAYEKKKREKRIWQINYFLVVGVGVVLKAHISKRGSGQGSLRLSHFYALLPGQSLRDYPQDR